MADNETYSAAAAQIGNSRGYRLDAALFQRHPELRDGSFEAVYLGEGTLLVRQRAAMPRRERADQGDADPVMAAYLAWTGRAMARQPDFLREMTRGEFEFAERLVEGEEVDLEHDRLPDDFELP